MKIYLGITPSRYEIKRIDFCCGALAEELVMKGRLTAKPWTDHPPRWELLETFGIDNCPYCGAAIINEVLQ